MRSRPLRFPLLKLSTMSRFLFRTTVWSTETGPVRTPNSAARRARYATRALATIVFVGVQPTFTQLPPPCSRSMIATGRPARASAWASGFPPCPVPMTIASHLSVELIPKGPFRAWAPWTLRAR